MINQPKEVVMESQTEEVRGEERKVREPLEGIKDATTLKGVMLDRDGNHSEKKGIGQTAQVIPKFFCCKEEGALRNILKQKEAYV